MKTKRMLWLFPVLALGTVLISGCGSSSKSNLLQGNMGTMVIMGTDYPTTSNVISFVVPISSITLSGNGATNVPVLNAPTSIDFSQLVGLRSLISAQPATPGQYTSATITFGGNPTMTVLNTTVNPPTVVPMTAAFTVPSVTVNFKNQFGDDEDEPIASSSTLGMMLDFRLDKSIPVDSSGNIVETGGVVQVTPVINLSFLHPGQNAFDLDEMRGGVLSVNTDGTFVIETRNRFQFTVATDSQTLFEPSGQSFSTLTPNDLVEIEDGTLDPSTLQIHAREVDVFTDKALVSGLVTLDTPAATAASTTCASTVSLLVRSVLPAGGPSLPEDAISGVALTGAEKYFFVHQDDDLLSNFPNLVFNSCSIVPGQSLTIGGAISSGALLPAHVMLSKQGFSGTVNSDLGNGMFTFNAQGLAGVLLPSPVTVETLQSGDFFTDSQDDSGGTGTGMNLHVGGLVLYNTTTNTTNILALRLVQPGMD